MSNSAVTGEDVTRCDQLKDDNHDGLSFSQSLRGNCQAVTKAKNETVVVFTCSV